MSRSFPLTQQFINITILEYMAKCFDLHFSRLLASVLHKINTNCKCNLYVDRLRYEHLRKRQYM